MTVIRPIRSEDAYRQALARADVLISKTDAASLDELAVLQALTEKWERDRFNLPAATPIEAIRFRMDQLGLAPRHLIPLIGSKSRVYEVLAGARPLSIEMIRALHRDLKIPAAALIGRGDPEVNRSAPEPSRTVLAKLHQQKVMQEGESFGAFLARAFAGSPQPALLRKTRTDRTNAKTDLNALDGWCAAVLTRANEVKLPAKTPRDLEVAASSIARLSVKQNGPQQVKGELHKLGIIFIVMEHFPGTYLDGAAMLRPNDQAPIIAMTLRHDRLDNFWFTLLHEYCHVARHLSGVTTLILDDLDVSIVNDMEGEADQFAQDTLIAPEVWSQAETDLLSPEDVRSIAAAAKVHPAVVAGRWQRQYQDYRRFAKMLGRGQVRSQFEASE